MEINIKKLFYTYELDTPFEREVLFDISLNLSSNKLTAIIGPTGSGKSTLVQHLNGIHLPTQGTIQIGKAILTSDRKKRSLLYDKVGMVFQFPEHQLFEDTVLKDISFGPRNLNWSKEEIKVKSMEALNLVGLDPSFAERSPFQLSGGEKRKVAIAGIIVMNPSILVLDEPTVGLDREGRLSILNLINQWRSKENRTVIMITHQMDDVAEFADDVIVINEGRLVLQTHPLTLFTTHRQEMESLGLALPKTIQLLDQLNSNMDQPLLITSTKIDALLDQLQNLLQGGFKS